jgi:hypothetical protein
MPSANNNNNSNNGKTFTMKSNINYTNSNKLNTNKNYKKFINFIPATNNSKFSSGSTNNTDISKNSNTNNNNNSFANMAQYFQPGFQNSMTPKPSYKRKKNEPFSTDTDDSNPSASKSMRNQENGSSIGINAQNYGYDYSAFAYGSYQTSASNTTALPPIQTSNSYWSNPGSSNLMQNYLTSTGYFPQNGFNQHFANDISVDTPTNNLQQSTNNQNQQFIAYYQNYLQSNKQY